MPKAGRKGDIGSDHPAGWPPSPAIEGSPDVNTNGRPARRKGDAVAVHAKPGSPPHPRAVSQGSSTVNINGKPAARVGDGINCGGSVATGSGNVFIGDTSWSGGAPMPDKPKMRLYITNGEGAAGLDRPYPDEPYKLYKDGSLVQQGVTGKDGSIFYEYEAPWNSELKVETLFGEYTFMPEGLKPVDTEQGITQRLGLLGYKDDYHEKESIKHIDEKPSEGGFFGQQVEEQGSRDTDTKSIEKEAETTADIQQQLTKFIKAIIP